MIVERDLIHDIKPFLERREFISITGPRQSGKTTFLKILKDYLTQELDIDKSLVKIITFENRKKLIEFEEAPISFIRSFIPQKDEKFYLMIDEFQYAEEGGQKLKQIYDTIKKIKIIITGSSSLEIKAHVGKFMVGRMVNYSLFPFNFQEYLRANNKRFERIYRENHQKLNDILKRDEKIQINSKKDVFYNEIIEAYEEFSIWGGYPAVVLAKNTEEKKKLLSDIYNNYILKDIKTLLELATEKKLFLLSQYLSTQIGNIVVYQKLGQASELKHRNLKKHLNILFETFICEKINPFFRNKQKELSKNPKIYFLDMGFRNNLIENMNSLEKRSDSGAMVENVGFIRLNELFEGVNKINFWRTKSGAEIDFVLSMEGEIIPIEIKYSLFEKGKVSKSFMSFINSFEPRKGIILTKNYWGNIRRKKTNIYFVPIYYL